MPRPIRPGNNPRSARLPIEVVHQPPNSQDSSSRTSPNKSRAASAIEVLATATCSQGEEGVSRFRVGCEGQGKGLGLSVKGGGQRRAWGFG